MKKTLKIAALLLALALIAALALFANSLLGNPVSKALAIKTARSHVEVTYPGEGFILDRAGYNFKFGWYHVHFYVPGSTDRYFSVTTDPWGHLKSDSHDDITGGWNTARRLDNAYRTLTDTVLKSPAFPFDSDIAFGTLEIYPREALDSPDVPDYTLIQEDLIPDGEYDIRALGAQAGHLVIYVYDTDISPERAAQIMLDLRALMDRAGIPFRAMDFHLYPPRDPDGTNAGKGLNIPDFACDDITAEGLAARLAAAAAAYEQRVKEK